MATKFSYKNISEMQAFCQEQGIDIKFSDDLKVLNQSLKINDKEVPNRIAIQPMEGFDGDENHAPGELSERRYKRYAAGGAGLIWFEATAVKEDAVTNPHQLILNQKTFDKFKRLVELTKETAREESKISPYLVLQLTHSGRFSKPGGKRAPLIAVHEPHLDQKVGIDSSYPVVSDEYLDDLQSYFVSAAELAYQAGFDAVDIKACHKYLVSELLGARERTGKYGGSYENRTRFLKEVVEKIKKNTPEIDIAVRLNLSDYFNSINSWGVAYQSNSEEVKVDLSEPLRLIAELKELGLVLLNTSAGTPYFNPHVNRPFDSAVVNGYQPPENQLYGVERLFSLAANVQHQNPELVVIGAGYSWLRQFGAEAAAGYVASSDHSMAGFGRQAFAYPDFASDILDQGEMISSKCCITCSKCSQLMIWGSKTGCVIRDAELYAPVYKEAAAKSR